MYVYACFVKFLNHNVKLKSELKFFFEIHVSMGRGLSIFMVFQATKLHGADTIEQVSWTRGNEIPNWCRLLLLKPFAEALC